MKTLNLTILTLTAGLALGTAARADDLTRAQVKSEEGAIASTYQAAKMGCQSLSGNAKDICLAEAKGKEAVAKADLVERNQPSAKHAHAVGMAKADAAYAVAMERCDDKGGNEKDVCVKEAKAAKVRAVAEAKTRMTSWKAHAATNAAGAEGAAEVNEAKRDAMAGEREADYAVAKEKCDALAGDAKDECIGSAKSRFAQH